MVNEMVFDPIPQYLTSLVDNPEPEYGIKLATTHKGQYNIREDILRRELLSKVFSLEQKIGEALTKTKTSRTQTLLPFPNICIIPEKLFILEKQIISVFLIQNQISGEPGYKLILACATIKKNEKVYSRLNWTYNYESYPKFGYTQKELCRGPIDNLSKTIHKFVSNFLDFLNNPEIQIIEHVPSEERNQKRIGKGKIPIPTRANIRITGKLKVYLDNFQKQSEQYGYSHRFWVRGHFRNLRSEKWTHKQGQKIWILPYIKGQGILINKTYQVVKPND